MGQTVYVRPQGLALGTLAVTLLLFAFAFICIVLRAMVRFRNKAVGLDDYLMMIGFMLFTSCCAFTALDCYSGLGTRDEEIMKISPNGTLTMYGYKWIVFFQITYAWNLPFIKSSICVALLRITKAKRYVYPLYTVMVVSIAVLFVGFIAVMLNCKPVAANWDASQGVCDTTGRISKISIVISVIAIITDWTCAIIPGFILWNLNMKRNQKMSLVVVLALGALASVSTIVRLPYIKYYNVTTDYLYNVANIVMWSMIECGVGIIAGCLPSLRPLLRGCNLLYSSKNKKTSSNDVSGGVHSVPLQSMPGGKGAGVSVSTKPTGSGSRTNHASDSEAGIGLTSAVRSRVQGGNEWEQLDDDDGDDSGDASSRKNIIMKNTHVRVEWGSASVPSSSTGSLAASSAAHQHQQKMKKKGSPVELR